MSEIAVALWIDDADYIDDRSEEALEYLLTMLDRLGIRATFKIAGEKARVLKKHGREDLIRGLCRHDLCYHSNLHSFHPTVIEYTEPLSFHEGAAAFAEKEIQGLCDVREIFGREIIGYGQPGEAWSPDVFPVLRKYGADVNLDEHFIIDADGMAFDFGGVLNFNRVRRILRYDYHDAAGLPAANAEFDRLAAEDFGQDYPEQIKLFSVFYHPSEFYAAGCLGDYYNFRGGKNLAYDDNGVFLGYTMPPALDYKLEHRYMELVGEYLRHMLDMGAQFVTASDLKKMSVRRASRIDSADVKKLASFFAGGEISFADIRGEYVSAADAFLLFWEYLSGKPLYPYLLYGPETREESVYSENAAVTREEVTAAMRENDWIFGYPQLKSLYRTGNCLLTPTDLCATAAYLIAHDETECRPVHGVLQSEQYVRYHSDWSNRWLFGENFNVPNTYEKTRLQCWTLKPIRY